MLTYSAKQARSLFSQLLKKAEKGEEIVIKRRGKEIARLERVPVKRKKLPSMKEFRKTITVAGAPMSALVAKMRDEGR